MTRTDMLAAMKTAEQMIAYGRYDEAEDTLHRAISKAEGRAGVLSENDIAALCGGRKAIRRTGP